MLRQESLYRNEEAESRGKRAVGNPEEKTVLWMMDLVGKLTWKRELSLGFRASTCHMVQTRMLFGEHRKLSGCTLYWVVLCAAESALLSTFALQVLDLSPDATQDDQMKAALRTFMEKWGVVSSRR